jgi:hypothetical protein
MTRDEILNTPAGREIEALIELAIFNRTLTSAASDASYIKTPNGYEDLRRNKHYSTDISAAWEVVEKLKPQFQEITIDADKDWRCYFDSACAFAETAPLAICRAALLAVMK